MQQEHLIDTFVFSLKLLAFSIPLFFVSLLPLGGFQVLVAQQTFWILQLAGFNPQIAGAAMTVGDYPFFISPDSTGWKSFLFLTALLVATPASWKKRGIGLAIGFPLLYGANLLRIFAIVLTSQWYSAAAAQVVHDDLWPIMTMGGVLITWFAWWTWARK